MTRISRIFLVTGHPCRPELARASKSERVPPEGSESAVSAPGQTVFTDLTAQAIVAPFRFCRAEEYDRLFLLSVVRL
jgi:hypothetical protein